MTTELELPNPYLLPEPEELWIDDDPDSIKTPQMRRQRRSDIAVEMYLAGCDEEFIAEKLHYSSPQMCYRAIMARVNNRALPDIPQFRSLQYQRLHRLYLIAYAKAYKGDLKAVAECKSILAELNKLMGANAEQETPQAQTTTNVLVIGGDTDSYLAALRQARELSQMQAQLEQDQIKQKVENALPGASKHSESLNGHSGMITLDTDQ